MKNLLEEIKFDAAFIKNHTLQPSWYKVLKVFLILGFLAGHFLIFGAQKTLVFCGTFFALSLVVHLVYRVNTRRYTRSWLDFKVEEKDGRLEYQRIGIYYYLMVSINGVIAVALSQLFAG